MTIALAVCGGEIVDFPAQDGKSAQLGCGVWELGIFDNGGQSRIDAAKQFIKYRCGSENAAEAGDISNFFSCCDTAEARTAWWNMLQKVGGDNDIVAAAA